jgi:hypothetical protein
MDRHQLILALTILLTIVVGAVVAWFAIRKRHSRVLRRRFGPEYDRVVRNEGSVRGGENVLEFRAKRREQLHIRPLSSSHRSDFTQRWTAVQSQFVDDPTGAVSRADSLVNEVMQVRGYPVGDFDQRAADISVDHPVVVENYRAAHDIALRHARNQASTEDLRKAMVHYRSLFDELLGETPSQKKEALG